MKVRLQLGVAMAFALLMSALLGIVVSMLYFDNRGLAIQTAQDAMSRAQTWSVQRMLATIQETEQTVTAVANFAGQYPEQARSQESLDFLHALARENDHHYSIYFGLDENGAFYQNVQLPKEIDAFGPSATQIPGSATRALRVIDDATGTRRETYSWSNDANAPTAFFEGTAEYDPRSRPWYIGALDNADMYVTQPYLFESTGQPGVTFAQRIVDGAGQTLGVAGIDMTMLALSRILEDIRIGQHGLVFMLDRDGQLMSYTGTRADGQGARYVTSESIEGFVIDSAVVAQAIQVWSAGQAAFFRFSVPNDSRPYLAYVEKIPEIFGAEPTLGIVVPEEEFVSAINRNTARALRIGGLALLVAILCTVVVSRLLSRSLNVVATEARRISTFDLDNDMELKTVLREVSDLGTAMSSMKAGLASFGAYVPKDLVRSIVSDGEKTEIGGTARDVTLMFSDLQGFTAKTEGLAPEELMPALSRYFEAMETVIADSKGTVDKYIGDAIMAMWNAPLDDPDHIAHACRAALACRAAEERLADDPKLTPLMPITTRFGLHAGRVIVGNVGSLSRMQYTALGSVVNLASRIEGLNKAYGTRILVSDAVAEHVSDQFMLREVDVVSPAGATQPTTLFELVGEVGETSPFAPDAEMRAELSDWAACYAKYRARSWAEALAAFEAHAKTSHNRTLVQAYIDRCKSYVETPPPENWDGVYKFLQK